MSSNEVEKLEVGSGENGDSPADSVPSRRRSGFSDPNYWTPERRQKQSEWARRAHADGTFGGKQPGAGRPRNKTVAEYVAEEAAKKGDVVWRELLKLLQHKSPGIQLGAIDRITKFEENVQKNMRDDEREIARLGGEDLQKAVLQELLGMGADIELSPDDIEDVDEVDNGD